MAKETTHKIRRHLSVLLVVLALVATACGGDSDLATGGASDGGNNSSGDASGEYGPSTVEQDFFGSLNTDGSVLPTDALSVADFTVAPAAARNALPVTPVIDTCAALSGSELGAIVQAASERDSFGGDYPFDDGTPNGAACTYAASTHRLTVVVGPASEVVSEPGGAVMTPIVGDATGEPWSANSDVTLFSEDSFDLKTFFAAHYQAGDFGVVVNNSGGTGIDFGGDGVLFGEIAVAAGSGAADAPAPPAVDEGPAVVTTADVCSLFTQTELESFLGIRLGEATPFSQDGSEGCAWGDTRPTQRGVRIEAGPEVIMPVEREPAGSGDVSIRPDNSESGAYIDTGGIQVEVSVTAWDDVGAMSPDVTPASVALAENLLVRLAG